MKLKRVLFIEDNTYVYGEAAKFLNFIAYFNGGDCNIMNDWVYA